jgi:hypothetical protein
MDAIARQGSDVSHRRDLAAQAGISLRYAQRTARPLHHRVLSGPSEIADAYDLRDYTPFALEFRRRFDRALRAYADGHVRNNAGTVRAATSVGGSWARAV